MMDEHILEIRRQCIEFAKANKLMVVQCWTKTGENPEHEGKAPVIKDWNNLEVLQKYQDIWIDQFLKGERNLGFVCGFGGLMVLDCDNAETWEKLGKDLADATTHVLTGKGNHQLYFTTLEPMSGFRVHDDPISVDVQGVGCCVIAPGSVNQKTQKIYQFGNDLNISEWPAKIDMPTDIKNKIFEKFGYVVKSKYVVNINRILQGLKQGEGRDRAAFDLATFWRKQGKTLEQTVQELLNWDRKNQPPLEDTNPGALEKCAESAFSYDEPVQTTFTDDEIYTEEELQIAQDLLNEPGKIFYQMRYSCQEHLGDNKAIVMGQVLRLADITNRVLGPSGSGKSHMIDTYVLNFPKSWVTKITSGTSSCIRYMGDHIPCLYITEERGMEQAAAQKGASGETNMLLDMKMAMSEGFISHMIPEKDDHGHMKTTEVRTYVDCFIVSTTKASSQSVEYTNRLIETCTDDSIEQTQSVVQAKTRARTMFDDEKVDPDPLHRQMRCLMQRIYQENMSRKVVIPWMSALDPILLADKTPSCRRYAEKLDKILEAVAQIMAADCAVYTRKDGKTYLIPGPEIAWYAWQFANDAIFMQMADMKPNVKSVWDAILMMFSEGKRQMTHSEIKSRLKHMCPTLGQAIHADSLKVLVDLGYLSAQSAGGEFVYKIGFMVDPNSSQPVTLKDLEDETARWLKKHPDCPKIPKPKLIHPFTGEIVEYDSSYRLTQETQKPKLERPTEELKKISEKVREDEIKSYEELMK